MDDEQLKEALRENDKDLQFTKQDRQNVFKNIEARNGEKNKRTFFKGRLFPITATALVATICFILLIPSLLSNQGTPLILKDDIVTGSNERSDITTIVVMVTNSTDRTDANLLVSFNKVSNNINVIAMPRSLKVPILKPGGELVSEDKLTHAYAYGSGPEATSKTLGDYFSVEVDYYVSIDRNDIQKLLEPRDVITDDVEEATTIPGPSGSELQLTKGLNRFGPEEIATLLGSDVRNEQVSVLIDHIMKIFVNGLTQDGLEYLSKEARTNIDSVDFTGVWDASYQYDVRTISVSEGIRETKDNGHFFIEFEQGFLYELKKKMKDFDW
ncbi:LCP family glycopolymer transferase [Alkalihalobacillus sp. CinArs1]|uniref:LCP family glycopolymer transferase n=1 Tax=Alkalihalobacillus sp. CinArs1 TaxID=2995314 RepID=UPI0022DE8A6F|nr:LCP family protein [Alkalihalobacillus sp. CinArs1]